MEDQDTLSPKTSKSRKFLFDLNNFDEDWNTEEEEEEPPPPVFTEEELADAKTKAYERGKHDGLTEATASREKFVANLLNTVTQHISTLFSEEEKRSARFEGEAIHLARTIFNRLFPALNQREGLNEIEHIISKVMENQKQQPEILIEVHSDYTDSIQKHIDKAMKSMNISGVCTVVDNDSLGSGDCRMSWNDGGGRRDSTQLAKQIEKELELILDDKPRLHDNGCKDDLQNQDVTDAIVSAQDSEIKKETETESLPAAAIKDGDEQ